MRSAAFRYLLWIVVVAATGVGGAVSGAHAEGYPVTPKACTHIVVPAERAACFEQSAEHFAGRERYQGLNAALAAPRPDERRVVFFGDSIVDNWSRPEGGGFFPGKPYVNRGIGGQTTDQMLLRFRQDVIALRPAVVLIVAGTNDVAGNSGPMTIEAIEGNLRSMAEMARASDIRVVFGSLLPVCDCARTADGSPIVQTRERPPAELATLNAWLAGYARDNGHGFVDYAAALGDPTDALRPELTSDGLHPNAAGYAIMAPLSEKAIAAVLR